jgi:glycosyltransferase involved in cell wall biosynthesis
LAKHHHIPAVFWLRNHAYLHKDLFDDATSICVPSEFTRDEYHARLDISPVAIPSPVLSARIVCNDRAPKYVTFVNPMPAKGLFFFAGIVKELHRARPDIPVLVVESRAGAEKLTALGLTSVQVHPHTNDPREFYRLTKMLLVPSLSQESFGRVVVEAQLNGIPILSSTRGGLRQTVGDGGLLFDIPAQYTLESTIVPPAGDVRPWVEAIIRLYDDPTEYSRLAQASRAASARFQESILSAQYDHYLRSLLAPASAPTESALPHIVQRIAPFFSTAPRLEDFPKLSDSAIAHLLS